MDTQDHSTDQASVDPMDEIASLLMGDDDESGETEEASSDEQTTDAPNEEDTDDAEELSDESTDVDETDESEEDTDDDQTLTEMLGIDDSQIDVTDDGAIMINVKVDGQTSQHSLAEVIKSYQLESSVTKKSQALSEERKKFEEAAAAKALEIKNTLEQNVNLTQMLEQELMADYEKVDWDDLRQYDPAEWTAKRQEFGTKYQRIQRLKTELTGQTEQVEQAQTQEQQAAQQAYLKSQWGTMIDNNPSWSEPETYKKDMGSMKDFAKTTYGFTEQDLNAVTDARIIELLKDAQAYRKGAKVASKKLKKVPRIQKRGGVRKTPKVSKSDKLTKAANAAKGAQKRALQSEAVAALLMGG